MEVTRDQVTLIEGTLGKLEIDLDRNTFHYDLDAGSLELLHLRDQELKLDSFKLELSASSGNVNEELRFLVSGINDAPLTGLKNLPPAVQDENYSFDLEVYDPEGQTAIISPIEIPDWLTLTESGVLFGRPNNEQVGEHIINYILMDEDGNSRSESVTLRVDNVNDAPAIEPLADSVIEIDNIKLIDNSVLRFFVSTDSSILDWTPQDEYSRINHPQYGEEFVQRSHILFERIHYLDDEQSTIAAKHVQTTLTNPNDTDPPILTFGPKIWEIGNKFLVSWNEIKYVSNGDHEHNICFKIFEYQTVTDQSWIEQSRNWTHSFSDNSHNQSGIVQVFSDPSELSGGQYWHEKYQYLSEKSLKVAGCVLVVQSDLMKVPIKK